MTLQFMTVMAGGGREDEEPLTMALRLARRHGALVEVLPAHPDMAMDMIGLGLSLGAHLSVKALDRLEASEGQVQYAIESRARTAAESWAVPFAESSAGPCLNVVNTGLRPAVDLAGHLDLTDLAVFGQTYLSKDRRRMGLLADALVGCRTPVLVARGAPDRIAAVVAIAWDGSLEAGHAVRAALPLLADAGEIIIVQQTSAMDFPARDADTTRLERYLTAHGLRASGTLTAEPGDEGEALGATAGSTGADLLVAGAYGHSRFREFLLGGTTRSFLADTDGPSLLLAH